MTQSESSIKLLTMHDSPTVTFLPDFIKMLATLRNVADAPLPIKTMLYVASRLPRYRDFLQRTSTRLIVLPNELSPEGSLIAAAAKRLGIHTLQYLHGTPTRLYTPSFSDSFWHWSKTTEQTLGSSRSNNLKEIGALEFSDEFATPHYSANTQSRTFNKILFLDQSAGDEIWNTNAFGAVADRTAQFAEENPEFEIRVRLHPTTTTLKRARLEATFPPNAVFTDQNTALSTDINWADCCLTGSSSASFAALQANKPTFLIWNSDLDSIHERPFLPSRYVIHQNESINKRIREPIEITETQAIFQEVTNSEGAMERAATHILELIPR